MTNAEIPGQGKHRWMANRYIIDLPAAENDSHLHGNLKKEKG
jgi:hypothetical protein